MEKRGKVYFMYVNQATLCQPSICFPRVYFLILNLPMLTMCGTSIEFSFSEYS